MKSTVLLVVVFGACLVAAGVYSFNVWSGTGGTGLGVHGWTALVLGTIATFGVGAGLMWLVFYSSRKGYDDPDRGQ